MADEVKLATDEELAYRRAEIEAFVQGWNIPREANLDLKVFARLDAAEARVNELEQELTVVDNDRVAITKRADAAEARVKELEAARQWQPIETIPEMEAVKQYPARAFSACCSCGIGLRTIKEERFGMCELCANKFNPETRKEVPHA